MIHGQTSAANDAAGILVTDLHKRMILYASYFNKAAAPDNYNAK